MKVKKVITSIYNIIIMLMAWVLFVIGVCMLLDFNKVVTLLDSL